MLAVIAALVVGCALGAGVMWAVTARRIARLQWAIKHERGRTQQYRNAWMKQHKLPVIKRVSGDEVQALGGRWWIVE